jgi:hypothetical protein
MAFTTLLVDAPKQVKYPFREPADRADALCRIPSASRAMLTSHRHVGVLT